MLPRIPIFFSGGPALNPGDFVSTTNPVIPRSVRANTETTSAIPPFVIHIFSPLITHSSPSRCAFVRRLNESDPARTSVSANAPIIFPSRQAGRDISS